MGDHGMITCIDTETTGDGPTDQVIELAAKCTGPGTVVEAPPATWLFQPTVPITPEARAVHHITDAELAEFGADLRLWTTGPQFGDTVAAHSADFDLRMIQQTWPKWQKPQRVICTYRCAKHIWPEAPRHGLQVLRYWLNLDVSPAGVPHRATYDTEVLAALVQRMLTTHTEYDLVRLTTTPVLLLTFPFGDYRGRPMPEVPMSYIQYMMERNDLDEDVRHTLTYWSQKADREPLLLETCRLKKYRGLPWSEVPLTYLQWILRQADFDCDTIHTARHHLNGAINAQQSSRVRQPDLPITG
jgi:exodeoxyribonuclease X